MNRYFWIVKRGPKPDHHAAPFHSVIVCARKGVADWEAMHTERQNTVWAGDGYGGWLIVRWQGFDVDYGPVVHGFPLPDGTHAGFIHDHKAEPWTLLQGAKWWDTSPIPDRMKELGVCLPEDEFSLQRIRETVRNVKEGWLTRRNVWTVLVNKKQPDLAAQGGREAVTSPSPTFVLRVHFALHKETGQLDLVVAHDEAEAKRMILNSYAGICGFGEADAWEVKQAPTNLRYILELSELLKGMDRFYLIQTLRRAGLVAKDACLDGKWYACVDYAEDQEEPMVFYQSPKEAEKHDA